MIGQKQRNQLLEILSDNSSKFTDCLKHFQGIFTKSDYFSAGWMIQYMIQKNV